MELILIERKLNSFQKGMMVAMTDVWLGENELRKALDAERAQRRALEARLNRLEDSFIRHDRFGDFCPHTGN